mmetsp:Transcript_7576/g.22979  ORF Transcript_7576/g.22979 Transcript_7576/m.22979 type:complete len:266 (+) Transcript_7576:88-885(+)|eukprot:CAMPEP_0198735504 /NCGR_PEP_ID=MMETSP1475-20131203/60017_1 /TAXON_ID= ORGANISM="Unidentified sp., Strain CCMP1999" /NCGR_SAMPLE_ID=MMETSP1475 /ASSEMBLY_ACC=CAM_ASM_001111 /LENGTH=265 /DNA_ID=CAMNT_0044499179 /DNA_START=76 /DNA_END=873 /DNA_ORIENTATION=-
MDGSAPPQLFERVFEKYDKNHDDLIDLTEFKELCKDTEHGVKPSEVEFAMKLIDLDGDGKLSKLEFEIWWKQPDRWEQLKFKPADVTRMRKVKGWMAEFDKKRDGVIDPEEFVAMHKMLKREKLTKFTLDDAFDDIDQDQNGMLSFFELVDWHKRINTEKVKVMPDIVIPPSVAANPQQAGVLSRLLRRKDGKEDTKNIKSSKSGKDGAKNGNLASKKSSKTATKTPAAKTTAKTPSKPSAKPATKTTSKAGDAKTGKSTKKAKA